MFSGNAVSYCAVGTRIAPFDLEELVMSQESIRMFVESMLTQQTALIVASIIIGLLILVLITKAHNEHRTRLQKQLQEDHELLVQEARKTVRDRGYEVFDVLLSIAKKSPSFKLRVRGDHYGEDDYRIGVHCMDPFYDGKQNIGTVRCHVLDFRFRQQDGVVTIRLWSPYGFDHKTTLRSIDDLNLFLDVACTTMCALLDDSPELSRIINLRIAA